MLIAEHGPESWSIARACAFACGIGTPEFDEAWEIGSLVQRKLGIDHTPDTAMRYLERRS